VGVANLVVLASVSDGDVLRVVDQLFWGRKVHPAGENPGYAYVIALYSFYHDKILH